MRYVTIKYANIRIRLYRPRVLVGNTSLLTIMLHLAILGLIIGAAHAAACPACPAGTIKTRSAREITFAIIGGEPQLFFLLSTYLQVAHPAYMIL